MVVLVFALATAFQLYRAGLPPTNPDSAHRWLYRMPVTHLGDFTLGMIAALLLRHARQTWTPSARRDRVLSPLLTIAPAALTLSLMAWPGRPSYYASLDAMWIVPAVVLCLGLGLYPRSLLGRLLSLRAVVFLGEVSFAFYLVHRPIMYALKAERFGAGSAAGYLGKMALIVVLITVVAIVCHFLVERPAQRLLNGLLRIKGREVKVLPTQARPADAVVDQPSVRV
ncbi:peptidoglycan/LPS O-acetylase OafA/YrhL [Allocatelliglobosispora scoriae]|uniref:Peptidoglycan/LPS O-acetylase OafA/YrhL n=1 Tax=Allocatelliglobosispora scoriae TaxID=643052 RepID=A0A841BN67_9ACTN|nr:acyltransferase family protein [Allocatelliglobosispora scoriae]MBB5868192.1 peptidoglycan/LPS O-acetylase OafA/YrhL [Allocatelliglobosispora scoriae]